jgi:hypothetical protein
MESWPVETAPSVVLMSCNPEGRYAEPMRGNYSDWIWCNRPATLLMVGSSATVSWRATRRIAAVLPSSRQAPPLNR